MFSWIRNLNHDKNKLTRKDRIRNRRRHLRRRSLLEKLDARQMFDATGLLFSPEIQQAVDDAGSTSSLIAVTSAASVSTSSSAGSVTTTTLRPGETVAGEIGVSGEGDIQD